MKQESFEKYWNKLLGYSHLCEIKVYFLDLDKREAHAEWRPNERTIYIHKDLKKKDFIISNFLHELGHFTEDQRDKDDYDKINTAYLLFNSNKKMTYAQKLRVYNEEKRAWEEGRIVAKKLKIRLGFYYEKYMLEALNNLSGYFKL